MKYLSNRETASKYLNKKLLNLSFLGGKYCPLKKVFSELECVFLNFEEGCIKFSPKINGEIFRSVTSNEFSGFALTSFCLLDEFKRKSDIQNTIISCYNRELEGFWFYQEVSRNYFDDEELSSPIEPIFNIRKQEYFPDIIRIKTELICLTLSISLGLDCSLKPLVNLSIDNNVKLNESNFDSNEHIGYYQFKI